ncbi:hypothetical protein VCHE16_3788 [Vibrio paracholerae HE-16]|nr:hypothetical protein VCHE16_3788 [Vibrio paracholerae HE-16]
MRCQPLRRALYQPKSRCKNSDFFRLGVNLPVYQKNQF